MSTLAWAAVSSLKLLQEMLSQDLPEAAPCLPLQCLLLPIPDDGLHALPPRLRRGPRSARLP